MRNLGITDHIARTLVVARRPLRPQDVAKVIPMPAGWDYRKLRRNVAAIMIHELRLGAYGRWARGALRGYYYATPHVTWVRDGMLIQHQLTGAVVRVVGKVRRNGVPTTLDRWQVASGRKVWPVRGEQLEKYWRPV